MTQRSTQSQTANTKKSFVLYNDFQPQLDGLTEQQAGQYLKAIYAYQNGTEYKVTDPVVQFAINGVLSQFKRDEERYRQRCEKNRENVKKRWESSGSKKKRSNTNVNDSIQTDTKHTDRERDRERDSVKYSDEFEKFWKAYPKKKQKLGAYKAWGKIPHPPVDDVIAVVNRLKESNDWKKEGGKYIPHPQTWINAGGWDDETEVESAPKVFKVNGKNILGQDLCDGLTFREFKEKYGEGK